MTENYVATARLRWTTSATSDPQVGAWVLQQWFAPNMPSYMADPSIGEWRAVPVVEGAP
jgi:hypothetical protein